MSDHIHQRCYGILAELSKNGDIEFWHEFKWLPKQKLEKRLKDVLESDVDEKYYLSDITTVGFKKHTINKGVVGMVDIKGNDHIKRVYGTDGVAPCLQTMQGGNREPKIVAMRGRNPNNPTSGEGGSPTVQMIEPNEKGTPNCLTTVQKDNLVLGNSERIRKLTPLECWRLQDFPDEAFNKAKEAGLSNSQLYKQAGNTMSVNVLEMIFRQIEISKKKM